jgi:putative nucleotidyltransferase with HDIG domain
MNLRAIHAYVMGITVAAALSLPLLEWDVAPFIQSSGGWGSSPIVGLGILIGLGLISESLSLKLTVGEGGSASITFLPLLTCVILFGPAAGVVFILVAGLAGELLFRRKPPLKALFNLSQWILATAVSGFVFMALDGQPIAFQDAFEFRLIPFAGFLAVFLPLNNFAVAVAIALSQGERLRRVWELLIGSAPESIVYDFIVSPVAILIAFLYAEMGLSGLVVSLFALLFIRSAYKANHRLELANRRLLEALVKAIEVRDRYTKGHSKRVELLARRICDAMNLHAREADLIEQAALLHDIGKIEQIYVGILAKPSSLTDEERKVIESHVDRGVAILKELSGVRSEVLAAVRHHHERMDGKGYPDGLSGKKIPKGARIIKICDAVDAMLSDRPYRKALDLVAVREQLIVHAGTQFDPDVVHAILRSDLLEEHQREIQIEKLYSGGDSGESGGSRSHRAASA